MNERPDTCCATCGADEKALYDACDKFTERFRKVEQLAQSRNIDMKTAQLSELDSLWDEVKK